VKLLIRVPPESAMSCVRVGYYFCSWGANISLQFSSRTRLRNTQFKIESKTTTGRTKKKVELESFINMLANDAMAHVSLDVRRKDAKKNGDRMPIVRDICFECTTLYSVV
jgi:hypothetical protein